MPSIAFYFLPVALFAISYAVAPAEEGSPLAGDSPRQNPPGWLFRKGALEAAIMGPLSIKSESLIEAPDKRDEPIWMPGVGYETPPTYDEPEAPEPSRQGNLLRYG